MQKVATCNVRAINLLTWSYVRRILWASFAFSCALLNLFSSCRMALPSLLSHEALAMLPDATLLPHTLAPLLPALSGLLLLFVAPPKALCSSCKGADALRV